MPAELTRSLVLTRAARDAIFRALALLHAQCSGIAQLVEQRTVNPWVVGSSPTAGANFDLQPNGRPRAAVFICCARGREVRLRSTVAVVAATDDQKQQENEIAREKQHVDRPRKRRGAFRPELTEQNNRVEDDEDDGQSAWHEQIIRARRRGDVVLIITGWARTSSSSTFGSEVARRRVSTRTPSASGRSRGCRY